MRERKGANYFRDMADKYKETAFENSLAVILQEIEGAAARGEYNHGFKRLSEAMIDILEALGFKVYEDIKYLGEVTYEIEW